VGRPVKGVFDTNILIDYLNGLAAAKMELARYSNRLISIITFIEVLVGSKSPEEETAIRGFLASFVVLELSSEVAKEAIAIRRALRLKVPDAIIYGTARAQGCMLVTRNTNDFGADWPDVRIPY